jgi:hypothetical protein
VLSAAARAAAAPRWSACAGRSAAPRAAADAPPSPGPQFGTVVDDPLDGPDGRLTKAERKATLTQQLLADSDLSASRKRRFGKLQDAAAAGATAGKKRKTDNPRKKPPKRRPKH